MAKPFFSTLPAMGLPMLPTPIKPTGIAIADLQTQEGRMIPRSRGHATHTTGRRGTSPGPRDTPGAGVRSIPTLLVLKGGREVDRIERALA